MKFIPVSLIRNMNPSNPYHDCCIYYVEEENHDYCFVVQTDVCGTCETHYALDRIADGVLHIGKRKNLDACSHRTAHFLSLQSLPYSNAGSQHSLPLIK